jgi:hypothetical protein
MHDDENLDEHPQPEKYLTEEEWEKKLIETYKLMDRYHQIFEENPERKWNDPSDLYMKAHHDIVLGEAFERETEIIEEDESQNEPPFPFNQQTRFEDIPVFKLAYEFSTTIFEELKRIFIDQHDREHFSKLLFGSAQIAAEIAGGDGLGYEPNGLCGNIVKNRWALDHANEVERILRLVFPRHLELQPFLSRIKRIQFELQKRIEELRSKVWW